MIFPWLEVLPAPTQMAEETVVQVELDIFSGRVNPTWHLSTDESTEFLKLFRALPPAPEGTIRDGLGYRSINVTVLGGTVAGFDSVRCSAGIVVAQRAGSGQKFIDRDRALERWLLRTSEGRIDEEIRAAIDHELDPKK